MNPKKGDFLSPFSATNVNFEKTDQYIVSKKKKGKVVSLKQPYSSPENYIKTQARSLPISECFITEGWADHGICSIIVARAHKTGNVTCGFYLVDLYCLGLKQAFYHFNLDAGEYKRLKSSGGNIEKCDYVLAHNIIYGAIAYAEDLGFKPDKDFAISQFILEEDDENVELMEIEFGLAGEPCYMRGPYDDQATINRIIATLTRTVGEGIFNVVEVDNDEFDDEFDEDGEFDDEELFDDEEFDGDDEEDDDEDDDYLMDPNVFTKAGLHAFKKVITATNKNYDEEMRTDRDRELLAEPFLGVKYQITSEPVENEYNKFDSADEEEEYKRIKGLILDDPTAAIKGVKKAIKKYPGKAGFYSLLLAAYSIDGQFQETDDLIVEMYHLFPGYLFAKAAYAGLLIDSGRPEGIWEVFDGKPDLGYLYPHRKVFQNTEADAFYSVMCRYFIAVGEIHSADRYMAAMLKNKPDTGRQKDMTKKIMWELCEIKMKELAARKKK